MISHSKRFIFIHVPKTAGSSLAHYLAPYARTRERMLHIRPIRKGVNALATVMGLRNDGDAWLTGIHQHASAAAYRAFLGTARFDAYFKFACVRNPFTWLLSEYLYIQRAPHHQRHGLANSVGFDAFVRHRITEGIATQAHQLKIDGTLAVDRVMRLERLQNDLAEVAAHLSLPAPDLPRINVSNAAEKARLAGSLSAETISMIRNAYAEDFALFDYPAAPPWSDDPAP